MRISRPLRDWSSWSIVPSTGSALYLVLILYSLNAPNRTGLLSGRPCGTLRYKQLSQLGGWIRNAPRTGLCACDPALDQQSGKAGTNVETPDPGLRPGLSSAVPVRQ